MDLTKDQTNAIIFCDAYTEDVGLPTYTQLLSALNEWHDCLANQMGITNSVRVVNQDVLTKAIETGARCHNDACCAGQLPCPSPAACGVAS